MTEKVSSEKDTEEVKKPRRKKKAEVVELEKTEATQVKDNDKSEIELLKEQIRLLQEANEAAQKENKRLLDLSARVLDTTTETKSGKKVLVKCLELNGVELSSPNRDTIVTLPYNEWVECDVDEMNQIFKKISNRTLFEDGICVMEDDKLEDFRIKVKTVIDMDKIAKLLDEGIESNIIKELNKLTDGKKKESVSHLILYAIVGKMIDGDFARIPRSSIDALEMYFGVKLRDIEVLLKIFRSVKG